MTVEFPPAAPTGLETRFRGAVEWTPTPEQAFALRESCPRIVTARAIKETDSVWLAQLTGERFDAIDRIGAILPDHTLADVEYRTDDAGITLPVACDRCEVLLGIPTGEPNHWAACTGEGYSIGMANGTPGAGP